MSQTVRSFAFGIALLVMLTLVSAPSPSIYPVANPPSGLVQSNASQYSQFYQMTSGPAPSNKISYLNNKILQVTLQIMST